MSNSVDPDETPHYEPSHLDLCYLQKPIIIACGSETVKVLHYTEVRMYREDIPLHFIYCFTTRTITRNLIHLVWVPGLYICTLSYIHGEGFSLKRRMKKKKKKKNNFKWILSEVTFDSNEHTHKTGNSKASIPLGHITKTYLYNFDPLKPHYYIEKLGFTGVYIIFLISAQKYRLWVLVRTASPRRF